jgi:hypothetical protein
MALPFGVRWVRGLLLPGNHAHRQLNRRAIRGASIQFPDAGNGFSVNRFKPDSCCIVLFLSHAGSIVA